MAKNRMINTRFWDDSWVVSLDPIEKLLFIYLITNSCTGLTGCYEISLRRVSFDTGLDESAIKNIFKRFEDDGKIAYVDGWVIVRNYDSHNPFKGEKLESAKNREVALFPDRVSVLYQYPTNRSNKNKNSNKNKSKNKNKRVKRDDRVSEKTREETRKRVEKMKREHGIV